MTSRRDSLVLLAAAALAPQRVLAQPKKPVLIGWLHGGSREVESYTLAALKEGLAALGWKEGTHFRMEERWANGRHEFYQPYARALAEMKPAVIVAAPLQLVAAAAKEAPGIPVVMGSAADPVAGGLAASLARPGGMVTGVTNVNTNINEKQLELLLLAVPKLRRIGFLGDSNNVLRDVMLDVVKRSAAQYPSVNPFFAEVAHQGEIEPTLSRLARDKTQALIVMASPLLMNERRRIIKLALEHRWPTIAVQREFIDEGALLTYGPDVAANFRRAATYVDKILKGAKPGDLPIEQPTTLELVVNMKTAKALGITMPQSILVRADRVIE